MEETYIIDKINNYFEKSEIFYMSDHIVRYESDDYDFYFYDNIIFDIENKQVCIQRYYYKSQKKTKIIYTYFGDYINGDKENERESIEIIKTSSRDKILTLNEIEELKSIFPDETNNDILTIFNISRKIANFVKKKCKEKNITGIY